MKQGENLPLEHDALLFLISSTGSFICLVTQTRSDIPGTLINYPVMDHWGKVKVLQNETERTADPLVYSRTRQPPDDDDDCLKMDIGHTPGSQWGILPIGGSSVKTAPPLGHSQGGLSAQRSDGSQSVRSWGYPILEINFETFPPN